jgi:hypothetical protein
VEQARELGRLKGRVQHFVEMYARLSAADITPEYLRAWLAGQVHDLAALVVAREEGADDDVTPPAEDVI